MNSADNLGPTGPPQQVYLNGRIVPAGDAGIAPLDRGFLYGDGFFETTRIFDGRAVFLDLHLERLAASCRATGFGCDLDTDALADGVRELIRANGVQDGYLRITVSRGLHGGELSRLTTAAPTVFAQARPMNLPPLESPGALVLAKSPYRRNEHSPVVRHKSLSYQLNVLALAEGRRRGAGEVYFLNSRGHLAEGAFTNLFWIKEGMVLTPSEPCGLLPGITRRAAVRICGQEGIPVRVGAYPEYDLRQADEVFCTNSLRGIMAVEKIVDFPDKDLSSHPLTERLQHSYAELVRRS